LMKRDKDLTYCAKVSSMYKKGAWTIKESKTVYENPWMKVVEDSVIRPDGKDGIHATVDIAPGVSILPITENNEVILLKNFQYALGKQSITSAGGSMEKSETPDIAAVRELKEETGLSASKWTPIGMVDALTSGIIASPNYLFFAQNLTESEMRLDGTENIELFKIPLQEAVKKVMDGEITHPATALLILKADFVLNESNAAQNNVYVKENAGESD